MSQRKGQATIPLPVWMWVPATVAVAFLSLPVISLLVRTDWGAFVGEVTTTSALVALKLSVVTATAATVCSLVLGVPLALVTVREFPGVRVLRTVVLLPLVLPPVVGGIALLSTFGRGGLLGGLLGELGASIAFSTVAVVVAQTFVSLPFVVLAVESALVSVNSEFVLVARTLGAGSTRIVWHVMLPMVRPAVVTGAVLAFARSLGEFGATVTFAGSLAGVTRTLPLEVYLRADSGDMSGAVALSVVLMVVAFVVVAAVYRRSLR